MYIKIQENLKFLYINSCSWFSVLMIRVSFLFLHLLFSVLELVLFFFLLSTLIVRFGQCCPVGLWFLFFHLQYGCWNTSFSFLEFLIFYYKINISNLT